MAVSLLVASLVFGMIGYMFFEHLSWIDAFLNAAMLLGGMGAVNPPLTASGKLFAGLYALYAGLVFIVTAALPFAPILHRVMHRLHWDDNGGDPRGQNHGTRGPSRMRPTKTFPLSQTFPQAWLVNSRKCAPADGYYPDWFGKLQIEVNRCNPRQRPLVATTLGCFLS